MLLTTLPPGARDEPAWRHDDDDGDDDDVDDDDDDDDDDDGTHVFNLVS